ncbi:NMRAL1 [Symbiodinium pilosum]|uniref:NMRAL1 protein n=1 Tax=Symbiodinium pilosum TaxID=2952 RepID=A0A812IX68_SYMPI|nr:NMRAL1 [Symbiodinium pilosum]
MLLWPYRSTVRSRCSRGCEGVIESSSKCHCRIAQHTPTRFSATFEDCSAGDGSDQRYCGLPRYGCTFDIGQFSRAGGAVAEGREYDDGTTWFKGWIWRMAICRNCGTHLGWRFESRSWNKSGGRGDAALFWGLIWRHLREHRAPGQGPSSQMPPKLRCPKDHPLRRYATPHGQYVCDGCNRQVKAGDHLWGCGACDFDLCDGCRAKVIHKRTDEPVLPTSRGQPPGEDADKGDLLMPDLYQPLRDLLCSLQPQVYTARITYAGSYWP